MGDYMKVGNYLKKRFNLFLVSAIFIVIALVITFIILTKNNFYRDIVINDKNIQVTFENGKKGIKFGEYPMSFENGLENSPDNKYKIVNKIDKTVDYEVVVTEKEHDENSLDIEKIVVCVNDTDCKTLDEASDGIIYTSRIDPKEETTISIKLWALKDLVETSDLNKSILLNIDIREIEK